MGVRISSSGNNTIANASIANATEGIVCTTGIFGLTQDNAQVVILVCACVSTGAGATSLTFRLRRGSTITSTQISVGAVLTATASTASQYAITYTDAPGVLGQVQYSLTVAVAGGAAAVTVNDCSIVAFVL